MIMKSKNVAAALAFFLGGLGAHKFYLGKTGVGIVYLLFCWTYIPSILAFIEFIVFLTMSKEDFDKKYNKSCISANIPNTPFVPEQPTHILSQDISKLDTDACDGSIKCIGCGAINEPDAKFCYNCGEKIK